MYWIPLFELLERRGFQVYLVDPRQTKRAAGHHHPTREFSRHFQWFQSDHQRFPPLPMTLAYKLAVARKWPTKHPR